MKSINTFTISCSVRISCSSLFCYASSCCRARNICWFDPCVWSVSISCAIYTVSSIFADNFSLSGDIFRRASSHFEFKEDCTDLINFHNSVSSIAISTSIFTFCKRISFALSFFILVFYCKIWKYCLSQTEDLIRQNLFLHFMMLLRWTKNYSSYVETLEYITYNKLYHVAYKIVLLHCQNGFYILT